MRRSLVPRTDFSGNSSDDSGEHEFSSSPASVQHVIRPHNIARSQIPGPAGRVQAALRQRDVDRQARRGSADENVSVDSVVPTQVYLDKANDDNEVFDADFTRRSWLSTVEYFGPVNGFLPLTPISAIKNCSSGDKVEQIAAIIKTCVANGFGGLVLTLKDPTGSIGATVHHKVLSEGGYGSELVVGAVVILRAVTIFKPTRSAQYLNITLNNMVKVIYGEVDDVSASTSVDQFRESTSVTT